MKVKRFFAMFLALLMFAGLFTPVRAQAATSGKCGKNVKWSWDGKGTLTISGTGAMKNYLMDPEAQTVNYPWWDFHNEIKKVVVKEGVTTIGANAFAHIGYEKNTGKLTPWALTLPDGLKKIGLGACSFSGVDKIVIPDSVTEIGNQSFLACQLAKSVKISKGLTEIPEGAFESCIGLKTLVIPKGVEIIEVFAFSFCDGLESITIPASVKEIGKWAFLSDQGNRPQWVCFKGTQAAWSKLIDNDSNDYEDNMLTSAGKLYCKPGISKQPVKKTVKAGKKVTFTVQAEGTGLSYQWQYRKPGTSEWVNVVKNGKSASYSLTVKARHNGYIYRCKVSNKAGTTITKTAKLTVQ